MNTSLIAVARGRAHAVITKSELKREKRTVRLAQLTNNRGGSECCGAPVKTVICGLAKWSECGTCGNVCEDN